MAAHPPERPKWVGSFLMGFYVINDENRDSRFG